MCNSTKLYNQDTFDKQFRHDIHNVHDSLLIESPFIRLKRVKELLPALTKLRRRGVSIVINTRSPDEHDYNYEQKAASAVGLLQDIGVTVLYTVKHHRKIAIIDRRLIYEGSLNILSCYDSCEIMRRSVSAADAETLINFIGINKYLI